MTHSIQDAVELAQIRNNIEEHIRGAPTCLWLLDEEAGIYNSICGRVFGFEDGGPADSGFKFCPFCGRSIRSMNYSA